MHHVFGYYLIGMTCRLIKSNVQPANSALLDIVLLMSHWHEGMITSMPLYVCRVTNYM